MQVVAVSDEAVAEFLPYIARKAAQMHGKHGAEFDDLYQEGSFHVFEKLRIEERPSHTGIKNRMVDWLRLCARRGMVADSPNEYDEDADGASDEA